MRLTSNPTGVPIPVANPTVVRNIATIVGETARQECDIVVAYYPNRGELAVGANGTFDIDRAMQNAGTEDTLDFLTPVSEDECPTLVDDIAADRIFVMDTRRETQQGVRKCVARHSEYSAQVVSYYERIDGETIRTETYDAHDQQGIHGCLGTGEIDKALEDADIDVEAIIEELEAGSDSE